MFSFSNLTADQARRLQEYNGLNNNEFVLYNSISKNIAINSSKFLFEKTSHGEPANPNVIPKNTSTPMTPLFMAMARSNPIWMTVRVLCEAGADPNMRVMGKSAVDFLWFASEKFKWTDQDIQMISKILKQYGARF